MAEAAAAVDAWRLVSRCWRAQGMASVPALDWASARALLDLAGLSPGAEVLDGLLCLETGALDEFHRRASEK